MHPASGASRSFSAVALIRSGFLCLMFSAFSLAEYSDRIYSQFEKSSTSQDAHESRTATPQMTCRDAMGNPVEWFAAFKFPNGYKYGLFNGTGFAWSPDTLQNPTYGAVSTTTAQMYNPDTDVSYIAYNDEPGNSGSSYYGHTKGFLALTEQGGFWMVHSVPNFPLFEANSYNGFPEREIIYGQSFLCMSLKYEDFDRVGLILKYNRPNIYYSRITSQAAKDLPTLNSAAQKEYIHGYGNRYEKFSVGAMDFVAFGKTADWGKDLYNDFVAPFLRTSLIVESWIRGYEIGPSCMPSFKYDVFDVETLKLLDIDFTETQDHSKWAISAKVPTTKPLLRGALQDTTADDYVCIGDINRMTSQYHRGGGTVCFKSQLLHSVLTSAVLTHDSCTSTKSTQ